MEKTTPGRQGTDTKLSEPGEFHGGTHFITIHPLESNVGTYLVGKIAERKKVVEAQRHFDAIERLNERIKDVDAWKSRIARAKAGGRGDPKKAVLRVVRSFNKLVQEDTDHAVMINEILKNERNHIIHLVGYDGIRPGQVFSKIPVYAVMPTDSDLHRIKSMLSNKARLGDVGARMSAFEISDLLKKARKFKGAKIPRATRRRV